MARANQQAGKRRSDAVRSAGKKVASIAALFFVGCGGGSVRSGAATVAESPARTATVPQPVSTTKISSQSPAAQKNEVTSVTTDDPADGSEKRVTVRTDAKGRKWLGDVPYDVFFNDPLAVAAEGQPSGGTAASATVAAAPANASVTGKMPNADTTPAGAQQKSHPAAEKAAAGSKHDWNKLVEIDVLDAEVKRIRNELAAQLQSVAKYNSHYQEIAVAGATLAAVAEIVAEYPGTVNWKENAPLVRDLGKKIHDAASAAGSAACQATKAPYEQLVDVLDGNTSAGAASAPPERNFAEVAGREGLMKRMDRSFQWLKKSGPAEQLLRKQSGNAVHESSLLAALGRVIATGHYDSADDAKYKSHAGELTQAASAVAAAAKSEDAAAFTDAVGRVQKRCDACHADFRFQ
jgi:cytochrome c556